MYHEISWCVLPIDASAIIDKNEKPKRLSNQVGAREHRSQLSNNNTIKSILLLTQIVLLLLIIQVDM